MMRIATLLIALVVAGSTSLAGSRAGVTLPDTMKVGNKTLMLNGMGLREATLLKVDVYVAGLYVETVSSNPAEIIGSNDLKMIVLRFKRDVDHDDITKAWREGFAKNATVPLASIQPWVTRLNAWMPSFNKGDTLAFTVVPGKGVAVDVNGVRKGVVGDDNFARSLVSIWLGPKPPTTALKTGMLGRHAGA